MFKPCLYLAYPGYAREWQAYLYAFPRTSPLAGHVRREVYLYIESSAGVYKPLEPLFSSFFLSAAVRLTSPLSLRGDLGQGRRASNWLFPLLQPREKDPHVLLSLPTLGFHPQGEQIRFDLDFAMHLSEFSSGTTPEFSSEAFRD